MRTAGQQALRGRTVHEGPGMTMPGAAACALDAHDAGAAQHRLPSCSDDVVRCSPILSLPYPLFPLFPQSLQQFIASGYNPRSTWHFAGLIQSPDDSLAAPAHRLRELPGHAFATCILQRSEERVQDSSGMDIADDKAGIAVVRPVRRRVARQDRDASQSTRRVAVTRRCVASRAISA
ncbi:hypothetical protein [Herbaspirillum sp. NPDC087042]|uniref:hypothetical protein n=1 Tax=Herbaspirillum sp. NPDC087042 TaxID=3364004 RepID=UPI00381B74F8